MVISFFGRWGVRLMVPVGRMTGEGAIASRQPSLINTGRLPNFLVISIPDFGPTSGGARMLFRRRSAWPNEAKGTSISSKRTLLIAWFTSQQQITIFAGLFSTSGLCVASVRVRLQEKSIIVSLLQAGFRRSAPRYQRPGPYQSAAECGQVSCGGVAFASKVQYSRAQSAPGILPPVNSNLRTLSCGRCRTPTQRRSRAARLEPRSDLFTCQFHLASLLACTKLASAQEANTLERDPFQRPIWYLYFTFPRRNLADLSRRPRPLGPRLPAPRAAVGKASGPDRRLQTTVPQ